VQNEIRHRPVTEVKGARKKTIGILGGMGPAATADFYRRIVDSTRAMRDQDHLHVLIDSQPEVPDRTAFLFGQGTDPTPVLLTMARSLEQAGADLLVIACNTAHAFAAQVAASVRVPLVNWIEEVTSATTARQPGLRRIGLLATNGTISSGLYQEAFASHDVQVLVPDRAAQGRVMEAIYGPAGVKSGSTDLGAARDATEAAGRALVERGAEAILLACTELSVLFAGRSPNWPVPTFDAAQVMAERVIILAGGEVKHPLPGR
jgi:aspartate racemase